MKIIGIMKNLSRNFKYRRDKKDEEDSVNLVDSTSNNPNENFLILSRFHRRIPYSSILRYIILIPSFIYFLIILTPIKNLQSFIPMEILQTKNFLIVVAHPDDECLFFSPTILGLISREKTGHLLVFSTGNSNGLGPIRVKELKGSCQRLGIDLSRCLSLNLTDLQDNPQLWWSKRNISEIIQKYIKQFEIDLLITFDRGGISGHVNHKSLAIGIEYYIENIEKTPLIYEISTVSSLFEYSSILDLFRTLIKFFPRLLRSLFSTIFPFLFSSPNNQRALFVSSPFGYFKGLKAFHAHRSQMLWYRHIYTTLSRHMFINDLTKVSIN
jgi:N-acetylglucosaminylphosphatidylinositol deacetylase